MRFFLNHVKEVIFFVVLILIMFFAWFFISNTFLNKNLHITKKENKEVIEKPVKKEEVVINKPVKKVKRKIYRKVKKTRKTNRTSTSGAPKGSFTAYRKRLGLGGNLKSAQSERYKKAYRTYRKVKKTRKTNWAERQLNNYRNGNESVFTPTD